MIGYAIRCSDFYACQGKFERNVFRSAFLTYAFNYVWSIGAAMNDAVAFNRRIDEAWSVSFAPEIKSLAPPRGPRWRPTIQRAEGVSACN